MVGMVGQVVNFKGGWNRGYMLEVLTELREELTGNGNRSLKVYGG